MASTYAIDNLFEPTAMQISDGLIYICDTGNRRVSRLNPATMTMHDSYDMPGMAAGERPFAVCVQGSRCYVLTSYPTGPTSARVDLVIYTLSSPASAAMTFWQRVTVSAVGIYGGPNPPQVGGLFLQYAGGYLFAGCFGCDGSTSRIVKLDLDGTIVSTTTVPSILYGMVAG